MSVPSSAHTERMSEKAGSVVQLLDLTEPALDLDDAGERKPAIVRRVARSLRGSSLVQRDTPDEGVMAAELFAYAARLGRLLTSLSGFVD